MPDYEITWSALHPRAYAREVVHAHGHDWRDRPPALHLTGRPDRPEARVLRVAACYLDRVSVDGVDLPVPGRLRDGRPGLLGVAPAPPERPDASTARGRRHGGMG